jgi:hypothetical protein
MKFASTGDFQLRSLLLGLNREKAMATEHTAHLEKLRAHLRSERRKLVEKMATGQNMPKSFTKLLTLQSELDAVGRAIEDERDRGR